MILLDQFSDHYPEIPAQSSVIERRRQMLGASAIAKVDANDVEARAKCFARSTQHVRRARNCDHAVPHDQCWMHFGLHLPATVGQDLASGFDLEKTLFI